MNAELKYGLKAIYRWASGWWPCLKSTLRQRLAEKEEVYRHRMSETKREHEANLAREREIAGRVIARLGEIRWTPFASGYTRNQYRLTLLFAPEVVVTGRCDPEELGYIADHFGRMVAYEIKRCKFMETNP